MPEVGVMAWSHGAQRPVMTEVEYTIVPRVGDLLDIPDAERRSTAYRVFAVIVHPLSDGGLAADVHVEQLTPDSGTCTTYVFSQRRATLG